MPLPRIKLPFAPDPGALLLAVPVSIVLVVGTSLSLRVHSLLRRDRELVVHSYQVIDASDRLLLSLADAESAQRGYLLTEDQAFLAPYQTATGTGGTSDQLQSLRMLLSDSNTQEERVTKLGSLTKDKVIEMDQAIGLLHDQGFAAAQGFVAAQSGKHLMDYIRSTIADMKTSESRLVEKRSNEVHKDETHIIYVAAATTALSTLLRLAIAIWRKRQSHLAR